MTTICDKKLYMKGGFWFSMRTSRSEYVCSECGKPIRKSTYYVEERKMDGTVFRYHPKCCEKRYNYMIYVLDTPSRMLICTSRGGY